ncbi:hypothetical protein ACWEP3_30330, partial [Streptomyces albidoflavus]
MRALTRTLVSVTTAVGIAAGTLGVAGTAAAAPAAQARPAPGGPPHRRRDQPRVLGQRPRR